MPLIDNLTLPGDLKKLNKQELDKVASEVRGKIVDVISKVGGHLSSSLGSVELSVALHATFDSPRDKIVWDVGHQTYAHKILTGRLSKFDTIRQRGGLSGFPKRGESPHDTFSVGHASTSISQALGIAGARDLSGEDFSVIAVIGDGSLSGGLALEGINNTLNLNSNLIVILNDNEMSISKPVGAVSNYLTKVRTSNLYAGTKERIEGLIGKIPRIGEPMVKSVERLKNRVKHFIVDFKFGVIFEELGFKYFGPIDGHDIPILMSTLHYARDVKGPVLIHIITKKGKGYEPAEGAPTKFHGTSPFDKKAGDQEKREGETFTSVFGRSIARLAESNKKIVGITAAMAGGTGLEEFSRRFPGRFYDVGIAEEHAISFASGFAAQGYRPVAAIYSTFLQRAYDQIIHDVCLNNLPVVFAIDRAGVVGEDGPTHHGVFDIAYLRSIPNLTVLAPADGSDLEGMLSFAFEREGPVAIRYPKGKTTDGASKREIVLGRGKLTYSSNVESPKKKVLIVSIGSMVYPSVEAAKLIESDGFGSTVINGRFVKPLDEKLILESAEGRDLVVTVEEGALRGGFGSAILELFEENGVDARTKCLGIPDKFVCHGKREGLLKEFGLDPDGIAAFIRKELES
jgi:1-deoxy-D-xylulose-5-phosphate synthase